ncbi:hypothetical protein SAMN06264364_10331 [Quadrisphaera granulorum]|uniref:Uncharacterized protein n=1 Tax=Quadrisphaera granulorum TaxID=317664 RepID=A0A316ACK1_9ACTN|nr:hypothetical protein BXY45_10331 [Quadrisphaera granulorum]SZE95425.1 hypothetical protein SAMN06264364_10331 [Quadrisphaera granulorum]
MLAVRVAVSGELASDVRARALGLHLAAAAAAVREQVSRQRDVVVPVLAAADNADDGAAAAELLTASLASADRVLSVVRATSPGASALLAQTAGVGALQQLGIATRALWSALVDHERLWAAGAAPLARRLLSERARTTCG